LLADRLFFRFLFPIGGHGLCVGPRTCAVGPPPHPADRQVRNQVKLAGNVNMSTH
jgi:hypothetical protein